MPAVIENTQCVSPYKELLSFEYLSSQQGMTRKKLSDLFDSADRLPSEALKQYAGLLGPNPEVIQLIEDCIQEKMDHFSIQIDGSPLFPKKLADADNALPIFYYRGHLDLLTQPSVSVVGSRNASAKGLANAKRIARLLVEHGYTIVSGLAKGIDTAAMTAGLEAAGNVIGVLGTPIDISYPKDNEHLQNRIGETGLLISQVPFFRYKTEPFNSHKYNFPARNQTMAALSMATVIVEAGETSGTRTQARACLKQGRLLVMMQSVYDDNHWAREIDADKVAIAQTPSDVIRIVEQEVNL